MTFPTAYLSGLGVGAQTLTFHFVAILSANAMGAPNTATLVIGVEDTTPPTINPATATFDKNVADTTLNVPVITTMTRNGSRLLST